MTEYKDIAVHGHGRIHEMSLQYKNTSSSVMSLTSGSPESQQKSSEEEA